MNVGQDVGPHFHLLPSMHRPKGRLHVTFCFSECDRPFLCMTFGTIWKCRIQPEPFEREMRCNGAPTNMRPSGTSRGSPRGSFKSASPLPAGRRRGCERDMEGRGGGGGGRGPITARRAASRQQRRPSGVGGAVKQNGRQPCCAQSPLERAGVGSQAPSLRSARRRPPRQLSQAAATASRPTSRV